MTRKVRAVVSSSQRRFTVQEFDRPRIGEDDALLRVEMCGICGSDSEFFDPAKPELESAVATPFPVIPGHEPLGILEEIGPIAAARWGVNVGDRVVVEPMVPCGHCRDCLDGNYQQCRPFRLGELGPLLGKGSIYDPPGLWGAYAEYLYLRPNRLVHRIAEDLPAELAVMYNPLGSAVQWVLEDGGVSVGSTVVILGSGQRGLMSVVVAKEAGAQTIIVTDVSRAVLKLDLAREFGADYTIAVDQENLLDRVIEITGGGLADVVLDLTGAPGTVADAIALARPGGRIVLAGLKGKPETNVPTDLLISKALQVRGAFGVHSRSFKKAIQMIESRRFPLERMHTHVFGLPDAERALSVLRGEVDGENAIHIAIRPDL